MSVPGGIGPRQVNPVVRRTSRVASGVGRLQLEDPQPETSI